MSDAVVLAQRRARALAVHRRISELVPDSDVQMSLRRRNTLRVGGSADIFCVVKTEEHLLRLGEIVEDEGIPVSVLGLGSNLIIPDEGVEGVVIRLSDDLAQVKFDGEDCGSLTPDGSEWCVEIGGGAVNAHVVRSLLERDLVGAEFLALVPGTMGAAVAMNAGTKWGETSQLLLAAKVLTPDGVERWMDVDALAMKYRRCTLPAKGLVTAVRLRVPKGDAADATERIRAEKAFRERTQPYKLATFGSVFRNPPGDYAGRLVEAAGMKGARRGGAVISNLHANWIVNEGNALADEVLALMAESRRRVYKQFGIWLVPEVKLLGGSISQALDAIESTLKARP